jgi:putative hydrolases of HD superfamily
MMKSESRGLAEFLYEMGLLKRSKRTGWWLAGIHNPESIADHSFRTAVIGALLAVMEGADPGKTALLCLFHDSQESRTGDIPSVGKWYVTTSANVDITASQVAACPPQVAEAVHSIVKEYEDHESVEASIAWDADKLECLVQAREYQAQGYQDVPSWIETAAAALRTVSAKQLADACLHVPPRQWWKGFADKHYRCESQRATNTRPDPEPKDHVTRS